MTLPSDGLLVVLKKACPTCTLVAPLLSQIEGLTIYTQDDPQFPQGLDVQDDRSLEVSFRLNIETVPTLIQMKTGVEVDRTVGWHRGDWRRLTGLANLGDDLPELRPGCGSLNVEPGVAERLALKYGDQKLVSREIEIGEAEDPWEACYARGWSDGLPVVPPTPER